MEFSGEGAFGGAMAGASAGSAGGPPGMAAGAIIGGLGGGLLGGRKTKNVFDADFYARRRAEISSFAEKLASARRSYMNSITSMGDTAFGRFMPLAQAQFANKGLQVNGGAYGAALARESARISSEMLPSVYEAERGDLATVENMNNNLFSSEASARNRGMEINANDLAERRALIGQGLISATGAGANMYGQPKPSNPNSMVNRIKDSGRQSRYGW
jgi:hypothetical protein